jgi:Somatomedin B domain
MNFVCFQIIIEAISGQTRLSDIAFDDVSILSDDECSDDGEDARASDAKDDDEFQDGVFSVESCLNRCFEEKNSTVQLSNHSLSCSCSKNCEIGVSCCPDFIGE